MKQKVIRKTLTGAFTEYKFDVYSKSFFVKNFTEEAVYVTFKNDGDEDGSFKIPAGMGEEVYINKGTTPNYPDTIYVKGTGEVEVEALEF